MIRRILCFLVIAGVCSAQSIDDDIYPRDIFRCLEAHKCVQVRGWKLDYRRNLEFWGSVDSEAGWFVATKGKEKRYFWVKVSDGVEGETGQSLHEIRVKQLETLDEDPYESRLMRTALFSDDLSLAWDGDKGKDGVCIRYPLSNLSMSEFPVSKEDCESRRGWYTEKDGINTPETPVVLKPYKETFAYKEKLFKVKP